MISLPSLGLQLGGVHGAKFGTVKMPTLEVKTISNDTEFSKKSA